MRIVLYVVLFLSLAVMAVGALYLITQFVSLFSRAPFVPTGNKRVREMIRLAKIAPGMCVVDLGCGDGRIVLAAAKAGAHAEGYEMNIFLVWWSRLILWFEGFAKNSHIYFGSYFGKDLKDMDVVFLYVLPSEMKRIESWLQTSLKPGARVIVHAFPFPTWKSEEVHERVYVYSVK